MRFAQLDRDALFMISKKVFFELCDRLSEIGISVNADNSVFSYVADLAYREKQGARAVYKIFRREIENRITSYIINYNDKIINIDAFEGEINVFSEREKIMP